MLFFFYSPNGQSMVGDKAKQADTRPYEDNDDWSVYIALLMMWVFIFVPMLFGDKGKR